MHTKELFEGKTAFVFFLSLYKGALSFSRLTDTFLVGDTHSAPASSSMKAHVH